MGLPAHARRTGVWVQLGIARENNVSHPERPAIFLLQTSIAAKLILMHWKNLPHPGNQHTKQGQLMSTSPQKKMPKFPNHLFNFKIHPKFIQIPQMFPWFLPQQTLRIRRLPAAAPPSCWQRSGRPDGSAKRIPKKLEESDQFHENRWKWWTNYDHLIISWFVQGNCRFIDYFESFWMDVLKTMWIWRVSWRKFTDDNDGGVWPQNVSAF